MNSTVKAMAQRVLRELERQQVKRKASTVTAAQSIALAYYSVLHALTPGERRELQAILTEKDSETTPPAL